MERERISAGASATAGAPVWLTGEEQRLWRQWLDVTRGLETVLGEELYAASGLSMPDYAVLVVLSEAPGESSRVSSLASVLEWERSRLSHHLARMEKRGLIDRRTCPEDARGQIVTLTDEGRQRLSAAAPGHVGSVRRYLFDPLDSRDLAALARITQRLLTGLRRR